MTSWLTKVGRFIASIFSAKTANAILAGIRAAAPYVSAAMELSAMAAAIVGGPAGKTIGAVLAVADKFGVQMLVKPDATDAELGTAIRDAIVAALKLKFPNASTADLNRAAEVAYGAVKAAA